MNYQSKTEIQVLVYLFKVMLASPLQSHMAPACEKKYAWNYIFVFHTGLQVPKHFLKIIRPSDANVCFRKILSGTSEVSEVWMQTLSWPARIQNLWLGKNQASVAKLYGSSVTDNKSWKECKTTLISRSNDELSLWHVKVILGSGFSGFSPTSPVFNWVLAV